MSKINLRNIIFIIIASKVIGVIFAVEIFNEYTPLIDSYLYIQGHFNDADQIRTWVVSRLASSLNIIGGAYFTHLIFGLISMSGIFYFYATGGRSLILLPALFLPSSLIWTSIAGKEALYVGALGTILVLWTHSIQRKLKFAEFLVIFMLGFFCFTLRPHYSLAIAWLFGSLYWVKNRERYGLTFPLIILTCLFCIAFFYQSEFRELISMAYTGIDPQARASRFEVFQIIPHSDIGFEKFKSFLPIGTILGIIGPMPSEVLDRLEFFPFFLEGVLILFAPAIIYLIATRSLKIQCKEFKLIFVICLIPSILICMIMHSPFGILNPGSAIRWRTNFEYFFYLAPILVVAKFRVR